MGCCSSVRTEQDKVVSRELRQDKLLDKEIKKLILLGAGCSGKSTFFKQLQIVYDNGFTDNDRFNFRNQIHEQMLESMQLMLNRLEEIIEQIEEQEEQTETDAVNTDDKKDDVEQYRIAKSNEDAAEFILTSRSTFVMKDEHVQALKSLWVDPAIKLMYSQRSTICVVDSTAHYMNAIDRVTAADYIPNDEDLFLVRYRTTGMAQKDFLIDNDHFQICDVGGQRSERRKWIHFFDNVTAVLFVASLSAYTEVTFEDDSVNAMLESLDVFSSTLRQSSFDNTAFILFLNKRDLFDDRILTNSLRVCWPDYTGEDGDKVDALDFIEQQFHALNHRQDREIYTHLTQATDTNNFKKVFSDVQHVVVDWALQRSGLY